MLSPDKANSLLMRLSSVAYLRIFVFCALLIGILTLVHSVFIVYMFYHFELSQGRALYITSWVLFALSGLQQVLTILVFFWSIKRTISDAADHKL